MRHDPGHTVGQLFDFVDRDYHPSDLDRAVEAHAFASVPVDERGDRTHIRSASPGGWRRELSEEEQRLLNERLGPTLSRYGYP